MKYLQYCPARQHTLSEIEVRPMTANYVADWHQHIHLPYIANDETRTDRSWSWPLLFALHRRFVSSLPALSVVAPNDEGQVVPVGMLLLIQHYPALQNHDEQSTFLWFLADAPAEAMQANGVSAQPYIGRVLVDTAIAHSLQNGHEGRIGLHAAPKGGSNLANFYERRCGLTRLGRTATLPFGLASVYQTGINLPRANDGRFFYTTEHGAEAFVYPWARLR